MSDIPARTEIGLDDEAVADEIQSWLKGRGVTDVMVADHRGQDALIPLIPIVIGIVVGVAALIDLIEHIRAAHQCEQIITYHDGVAKIQIVKDVKNGKILIFADKDTAVDVRSVGNLIDYTELAKTALTAGAEVAKKAVDAAGGQAEVTKPSDNSTKTALARVADAS